MNASAPRTILQIYAAAVCFVSVACLAVAAGIVAYSAIGVLSPATTAHPMSLVPPPALPDFPAMARADGAQPRVEPAPLSAEAAAKRDADALERGLRQEAALARQSLVRWGIVALISSLLFAAHWRLLRRESAYGASPTATP